MIKTCNACGGEFDGTNNNQKNCGNCGLRLCPTCGFTKEVTEFSPDSNRRDGLRSWCTACQAAYQAQYRAEHKEERAAYDAQYRAEHKEEKAAKMAEYNQTLKGRYSAYKSSAKKRGLAFDLTLETFDAITQRPCHYCGIKENGFNGVDREDNDLGYTVDNAVPCCSECNMSKHARTTAEFIAMCERVVRWNKKKVS